MRFKKMVSKSLVAILFLNTAITSFAGTLLEGGRYETLEGEYITIEDSEEDIVEGIEIFGNTVQDENNLEDIQSVGDLYVDENGDPILDKQGRKQYKIEIASQNKNLFDINNEWAICTYAGGWISDEEPLHYNFVDNRVVVKNQRINYDLLGYKLKILGNESISVSIKDIGYTNLLFYACYSRDWEYTKKQSTITSRKVGERSVYTLKQSDIPEGTEYVLFGIGNHDISDYEIEDIMIEYGENVSSYIPNEIKKVELLLPAQLQKVRNISDRLYWDSSKGRYVIEKNIKKVMLNGTATWRNCEMDIDETMYFQRQSIDIVGTWGNPYLISDKLKAYDNLALLNNSNEGICTGGPNGVHIEIRVLKPRLDNENVSGFISWLKSNIISVYYASTQPILFDTNITSKLAIPTYDNKTYIYTEAENGVNPTIKITVDRINKLSREAVEKAEAEPTSTNISLARMWVNQMDESFLKDQLQERLNSISGINDLEIDRKTLTANLDVYIKSDNALSMSLSTNSVTFEGYSGIDDLEKLNAVDVIVSSSLPYDLNAYLEESLQNSDKTSIMSPSTINIRQNGSIDYNQFTNTTDKVILNDNCNVGNNNVHSIDLKLSSDDTHKADVYKAVIKFEAVQK